MSLEQTTEIDNINAVSLGILLMLIETFGGQFKIFGPAHHMTYLAGFKRSVPLDLYEDEAKALASFK